MATMRTRTIAPPEELPTSRGVYPCLVLPFDEPVHAAHEDRGRVYMWGDVRLPRGRPLAVTADHDGEEVGAASHFILTRQGIWCAIKVGKRGEQILRRGPSVSAEVKGGEITSVALIGSGTPGFRSARIHFDGRFERRIPTGVVVLPGLNPRTGTIEFFRPPTTTPVPAPSMPSAGDLSDHARKLQSFTMSFAAGEVDRARERFAQRQEELGREPLEGEEQRLLAAGVPTPQWPAHTSGRQRWDAHVAQVEAAEAAEYEAKRTVQLLEFELAAAAVSLAAAPVPLPRRRWWGRWRRK